MTSKIAKRKVDAVKYTTIFLHVNGATRLASNF